MSRAAVHQFQGPGDICQVTVDHGAGPEFCTLPPERAIHQGVASSYGLTPAEFLLARIEEDERAARDVQSAVVPSDCWDADRVLSECRAKRDLVGVVDAALISGLDEREILLTLCAVYADRADYPDSWR